MQYYLIHNLDKNREQHMLDSFKRVNIDNKDVKWVLYPNIDDIDEEFIKKNVMPGVTYTCGRPIEAQKEMYKGQMACVYKHYLCLQDIVNNNYEYAVIMEDNMYLIDNVPRKLDIYIEQLNRLYPDWDILFDCHGWDEDKIIPYIEQPLIDGQIVYPKSNERTYQCHGATKCARFYLIRLKCAKKLYENFLPFNFTVDWWMNDLFRIFDIKSFWAEPFNVGYYKHVSTSVAN